MSVGADTIAQESIESYRRELTGYCYRMLGSAFDADDAVQETMVRAWRAAGSFEGRSSVRSWLYRIATNVCLDMLRGRQRRARPMELGPSCPPVESHLTAILPEGPGSPRSPTTGCCRRRPTRPNWQRPASSIRLAFVAALQHLPPRQRAVLILCEVLRWQATEAAELLGHQRACGQQRLAAGPSHACLAQSDDGSRGPSIPPTAELLLVVCRRLRALRHRTTGRAAARGRRSSPCRPTPCGCEGAADIGRWMLGPGIECQGSRLLPTVANGCPAFGQYRVDPTGGHRPWALQVIETSGDRISGIHAFLDTERLFPAFGLPSHLP